MGKADALGKCSGLIRKEFDMTQLELFNDPDQLPEKAAKLVFCWFFRHPKTGKIIHAKNGHPFRFYASR